MTRLNKILALLHIIMFNFASGLLPQKRTLFRVELRGSSEVRTEQAHLSEAKMSVAKGVIRKQA